MRAKYKMTGCARFAIFLLIMAPIAYFGSKYLKESGTWDKVKEKIEQTTSSDESESSSDKSNTGDDILRDIENNRGDNSSASSGDDILRDIERGKTTSTSNQQSERDRIIEEQRKKIEELERRNQDLQNQKTQTQTLPPAPRTDNSQSNTSGSPSMDDLLREADQNLGNTPSGGNTGGSANTNTSTAPKRSIAKWTFSVDGASGQIEFYQQDGRFLSRIDYSTGQVDVDELYQDGDRIVVRNSEQGEYYKIRQDGNLDAYTRSGYLTTCRLKR